MSLENQLFETDIKKSFLNKLETMFAKDINEANDIDKYIAFGHVIRDYVSKNWVNTNNQYLEKGEKQVYYFSLEFLLGRLLDSNLINLDIRVSCKEALKELGIELKTMEEQEPDAGLGNGGLGRLGACFLDSMASLSLPGHGCGIRYKYGLFEQKIIDGYQVEYPDNWLKNGNVWEIRKPDKSVDVRFGGKVRTENVDNHLLFIHENYDVVRAVPYDTPIIGYKNNTVNTLRLWSAEVEKKDFDFQSFSQGDYMKAVEEKYSVEAISQVLYPDDNYLQGKLLRLKQQYFFVSAGLQSIVRRYKKKNGSMNNFDEKIAIHINDTHPVLIIPELMRILMDEENIGWDEAWKITSKTVSYTNHTTMAEALEKWPVEYFKNLLPRIYMIVEEINERFCRELWNKYPGNWDKIRDMAIVSDGQIKMANLAVVGAYSVNGVAKIHTDILKKQVLHDFYQIYPYKFNNKTNGITHRRWLIKANPLLAELITDTIGNSWIKHPTDLITLKDYAKERNFQEEIEKIKKLNKLKLAEYIKEKNNIEVDLDSIFDVQVKRMHSYKRQILNILHIMDLYDRLKHNPSMNIRPRTFIFGAKAAPGYFLAKQTIKLINTVATLINTDQSINSKLKVVFLENYRVTLAELVIPAADVSEQISTAGKEASGTGNMKFMMNGAITIGTLDGANIEIKEVVGDDNIVIFGLNANEVQEYYHQVHNNKFDHLQDENLNKRVLDRLVNGFLAVNPNEFRDIYNDLLYNDEFLVMKDFPAYMAAQEKLDKLYSQREKWTQMSICNIAHAGNFSSDRTINEYATGIWKIQPVNI